MGRMVVGVTRFAVNSMKKTVSTFSSTHANIQNLVPKNIYHKNLIKNSRIVHTRNLNERSISDVNCTFKVLPYDCKSCKFSTSPFFRSFNEPSQPMQGKEAEVCCWNCKAHLTSSEVLHLSTPLTCSECNVLRRIPQNITYFELFGIPRIFKTDLKKLAQKYKSMQRILHPDR